MMKNIVSAKWLHTNFNNPNLIILDASPASNKSGLVVKYPNMQIKDARKFDFKNDFSDSNSPFPNMFPSPDVFEEGCQNLGINNQSIIVVYDNLGIYSAPRVWWMFKTMGHQKIAVLDGGLTAWIEAGYSSEGISERDYKKGNFKANFQPKYVVDINFIEKNIKTQEALVVDARSSGRFLGTAPDPREGLPSGSIPNSVNLPFKEVLNNGKFKKPEALKLIFAKFNIEKEKPLVFSCGSGITACIILLAANQVITNPKTVFDGSWTQWALTKL